jgi:hypothetical protein
MRVANGNGLSIHQLTSLLNAGPIGNADIDDGDNPELVSSLGHVTGIDEDLARQTTLDSITRVLSRERERGVVPWLLVLRSEHRKRRRAGLQACTQCLDEDGYFRKIWRLGFVTTCSKHKRVLIDRCAHCNKPIRPWNSVGTVRRPGACVACDAELPIGEAASDICLEFQRILIGTLSLGLSRLVPADATIGIFENVHSACLKRLRNNGSTVAIEQMSLIKRYVLIESVAREFQDAKHLAQAGRSMS